MTSNIIILYRYFNNYGYSFLRDGEPVSSCHNIGKSHDDPRYIEWLSETIKRVKDRIGYVPQIISGTHDKDLNKENTEGLTQDELADVLGLLVIN